MALIVCTGRGQRGDGGLCRNILGELVGDLYVLRNSKRQATARQLTELLCRRCGAVYRDGARVLVVSSSGAADRELTIGVAS